MAIGWNPFSNLFKSKQKEQEEQNNYFANKNANYGVFKNIHSDVERAVSMRSITTKAVADETRYASPVSYNMMVDGRTLALPLTTNKADRIRQYREIAKYPEVAFCIDEIVDDFLHNDENDNFINLTIDPSKELNETKAGVLQNEFNKFIEHFKLKDNAYNIIKRFVVEGELCWENVIKPDMPEYGIVGVKFLPSEYFETLIDMNTSLPIGILFDADAAAKTNMMILSNGYAKNAQVFSSIIPATCSYQTKKDTSIPLLYSQLTYVNSGELSPDNLIAYPIIEKAKQAYHQLALLQDSAVILRVTRAPERLLFNVSTGRMNQNYAEQYVRDFANSLKSKKVATRDGQDIAQVYNPVSMLESYVFGKSDGNDGTSVESVGSSADYEQIADIEFFLRRLMKQLKVPFSRYKTPENMMERNETITYEEYSFSRMIIRFQRRFAEALKRSFIVHLKLKGTSGGSIWEKYKLKERDLKIEFVKPVLFDLYQSQKLLAAKMELYNQSIGQKDEFSKTLMMKKYLGMTDEEIEENVKGVIKDAEIAKMAEYYADKMGSNGPAGEYAVSPIPIQGFGETKAEEEDGGSDEGGGDEGGEGGDDSAGGDEGGGDEGGGEAAPAPTFGLG